MSEWLAGCKFEDVQLLVDTGARGTGAGVTGRGTREG